MFGQLLSEETSTATNSASTPTASDAPVEEVKLLKDDVILPSTSGTPASPRDVDPNLREHMVGILFSRRKLTTLQKKVCYFLSTFYRDCIFCVHLMYLLYIQCEMLWKFKYEIGEIKFESR